MFLSFLLLLKKEEVMTNLSSATIKTLNDSNLFQLCPWQKCYSARNLFYKSIGVVAMVYKQYVRESTPVCIPTQTSIAMYSIDNYTRFCPQHMHIFVPLSPFQHMLMFVPNSTLAGPFHCGRNKIIY